MMYGVYENKALVHWPPSKIFGDEIKAIKCAYSIEISCMLIFFCSIDYWVFCANLLLSSRSRIPG